jgi:hypothetical protein
MVETRDEILNSHKPRPEMIELLCSSLNFPLSLESYKLNTRQGGFFDLSKINDKSTRTTMLLKFVDSKSIRLLDINNVELIFQKEKYLDCINHCLTIFFREFVAGMLHEYVHREFVIFHKFITPCPTFPERDEILFYIKCNIEVLKKNVLWYINNVDNDENEIRIGSNKTPFENYLKHWFTPKSPHFKSLVPNNLDEFKKVLKGPNDEACLLAIQIGVDYFMCINNKPSLSDIVSRLKEVEIIDPYDLKYWLIGTKN